MAGPKDIKKLMNVAKGAKSASKAPDLDEILGRLPKIDPALQAKIDAELNEIRRRQREAYNVPQLPKETGRKALAEARRILMTPEQRAQYEAQFREQGLQSFLKPSAVKQRMYHGTNKDFSAFGHEHQYTGEGATASGSGFYFTESPESASRYALMKGIAGANVKPVYLNIKNPLHFDWGKGEVTGANINLTKKQVKEIIESAPNIRDEEYSPLTNWGDIRGKNFEKTLNEAVKSYADSSMLAALRNDFFLDDHEKWLRSLSKATGYDSATTVTPTGERHYIAWFPEQIKSATGNIGTYDIENPDITKAEGGLALAGGGGKLGKVLKALSGKAGKSLEAAQNLLQADRPLSLAERQFVADVMAKRSEELASLRPQEIASTEAKKSKGPSPKPDRAKPKTKAEISAIAERIAPQMLGEFVRGEKGSASVVGKSRKQWEMEQELQHDMQRSREVPDVETVDLEPHLGSVMLSLPGDTSISDYDIFSIGGNKLREPARQYGGPRFGLGHPEEAGWASGLDQAAGFQRRVNAASQQYGDVPVLANYLAMGPEGLNYATHFTDTLLKSIDPTKMSAKDIDAVNRALRAGKQGVAMPDFPGIENPEAAYLYLASNPVGRKLVFNPSMQLITETEALGLPSGLNVRHAITEPELRDIEPGMTGFSLLQMQPGVTGLKPSRHPTYSHDIPGKFLGRTDVLMPYELTFPDTVAAIRANPQQAKSEFGTLQMLGGKQIIDQQLLDEIGEYRRRLKQLTGKAEGGVVHMQGGGNPGDVSGEMFKPKPLKIPSLFQDTIDALKAEYERNRRSMVRPGSAQDVLMRGPVAQYVGTPMDIVGDVGAALEHVQKTHPLLRKPASVMDTGPLRKPEMGFAPRVSLAPEGPYGTEAVQEMMKSSGMTTGTERPIFEMGASLLAPTIGVGSYKLGKALAPTAREILEAGLEKAVEPTRMYAAPPSKPGKVKAPANRVGFYNPAEKAALNLQRKQGPGSAFISDMKKLEQGVNDERIAELGLDQLASKPNVTRDEVVALAEQNRIPLKETVRRPQREVDELDDFENTEISLEDSIKYYQGGIRQVQAQLDDVLATAPDSPLVGQYQEKIRAMQRAIEDKQDQLMNAKPAKFGPDMDESYSLPGGEDYREIRVRLPSKRPSIKNMSRDEYNAAIEKADREGISDFMHQTHHDDEPNVLFHLRVANHVDEEGKRGLLIDELQSDWHQKGRDKGYGRQPSTFMLVNPETSGAVGNFATKEEAEKFLKTSPRAEEFAQGKFFVFENKGKVVVPDAPFKDNWYQLGLKRAIKEAVDTGMERVYLTTGARQADRYDLSKHIDRISLFPNEFPNKTTRPYYFVAYDKTGRRVMDDTVTPEKLQEYIGKDASKKLLDVDPDKEGVRYLTGADLSIGGEGMRQYYDKTYKNFLEKYAKQHGGKLGMTKLEIGKDQNTWPAFRDWFAAKYPPGSARGGSGTALYQWEEGANNKFVKEFTQGLQKKYEPVYYIDLTDAMRNSAKKGQSYKDGGSVQSNEVQDDLTDRFNQMLQAQYAEGGAVDLTERFNKMLQAQYAEGGEVNSYNSDPDMSERGLFIPAPAFANGGAVKSIWTVN